MTVQAAGGGSLPRVGVRGGVAVGLLAVGVRLALLLHGGGLTGIHGYDEGVYYAAATEWVWGKVPYRDFVLLHPPGVVLLEAPFALLGRLTRDSLGFETARVATVLVGGLNAALVTTACRRLGRTPALAAGAFYALWTPVALTETNFRLEPFVNLGLLVALALLGRPSTSRRALGWAGAALALAVSVKIWAAAPVLLLVLWVWRDRGPRGVRHLLGGGLLAVAVLDLPFLLLAPSRMVHLVVLDQLGRGASSAGPATRLLSILVPGSSPRPGWQPSGWLVVLAVVLAVCVLVGCARTRPGRVAGGLLGVELAVLLLSPSYFGYYAAFAATGLALTVGSLVALVPTAASAGGARRRVLALVPLVAVPVVALATLAAISADATEVATTAFPGARVAHALSSRWCVTSDAPDALILSDVYTRDLSRGCAVAVDLTGLTYAADALPLRPDGFQVPRTANKGWQRDLRDYLFSGDALVVMRARADGVDAALRRRLGRLPVLGVGRDYRIYANAAPQHTGS